MRFKKGELTEETLKVILHDLSMIMPQDKDGLYYANLIIDNLKDIWGVENNSYLSTNLKNDYDFYANSNLTLKVDKNRNGNYNLVDVKTNKVICAFQNNEDVVENKEKIEYSFTYFTKKQKKELKELIDNNLLMGLVDNKDAVTILYFSKLKSHRLYDFLEKVN